MLGDEVSLECLLRCPLPARAETTCEAKITGMLALAALEVLRAEPPQLVRRRFQQLLEGWADDLLGCMDGYLRDVPGQALVGLWGYHQFPALAEAGVWLNRLDYVEACAQTVERLVEPTLAAGFLYAFPGVKEHQCAYCLTPMIQGLAALYRATNEDRYCALALRVYSWFTGSNDAGTVMYDPRAGRCLDGITGGQASLNCGAESAIEAGLAELERRRLARE